MKKNILQIFLFLFFPILLQAQVSIPTAKIISDNFQHLQVYFSVGNPQVNKVELFGRTFVDLSIEGMQPSGQVGAPNLPTWSAIIEVPVCNGYEVTVSGEEYDTIIAGDESQEFGRYQVVPVQPSYSKSDRGPHQLSIDERIYNTNALFSAAPLATVEHVGVARDRNLARLQFSPVRYNPVSGEIVICRRATVNVRYAGADEGSSMAMFERYYSPMFGVGNSTFNNLYQTKTAGETPAYQPVRYLIVAHSMFHGKLDNFVNWKRRKGFITDIVYTDNSAVGTTNTSISNYIKSQYTNATAANPAPTYLLIVGDHEQIPAFTAQVTSPSNDHITDLYYASWTTGDHIPDCYMGRFSAQSIDQLTPQIEKTLMYEQYTFADPSFLDRAVMVAGVDGGTGGDYGYTHADPAMDYAITNYVNGSNGFSQVKYFKNNTSIVPSGTNVTVGSSASSNSATVRNYYNQGAGWINYSAHGSATSWGTPSFTTTNAAAMTNTQKFGIMIGNCCLTNKFETTTCLGESVLRKGNYCGAVGYIGGSNSTYWYEDFYWAVGVRSSISPTMSMSYNSSNLGVYDRAFHTHNEAYSNWATSQGSIVMYGNLAVESSSSSYKYYYWEIYHLMGDPSLMPYLTQAQAMTLTASSVVMVGTTSLTVSAAPYAYVALTDTSTRSLIASGYANASGSITLTLPSSMSVGGYELAATAQQYQPAFKSISVVPSSGPYPVVVEVVPTTGLIAGSSTPLRIKVANLGNSTASNVTVTLTSDNTLVTLSNSSITVGNITVGDTVTVTSVTASASPQAADATNVLITANTQWSGSSTPTLSSTSLTVNAPDVAMTVTTPATNLLPDSSMTVTVRLTNNGHAAQGSSQLTLSTGNPLLTVTPTQRTIQQINVSSYQQCTFQLHAASNIDTNIFVPIYLHYGGSQAVDDTLQIYIGINSTETFEGGIYQLQGWTHGTYPWTLTNEESYEGSWCARSAASLGNNNTSEIMLTFNVASADSVSFYYKVSSEQNYDKFHCYIDGVDEMDASGEVDWTRASFPVNAGSHTLRFTYEKDVSIDRNSDCAWIDNITLPHGANTTVPDGDDSGDDGDDDDDYDYEGSFSNFISTFESSNDDGQWTLVNGSLTNVWTIGSNGTNGSGRGLYITNDNGASNAYTINSASVVFAYTTLWFDTGSYNVSFDWRCNGESTWDFMRVALVPNSVALEASTTLPSGWTYDALPSDVIALDGGQKLNLSTSWATQETEPHVSQAGWYKLVFMWRNDNSIGNLPPAAIDNVRLTRNIRYDLDVTATHGVTTGSGSYLEGEIATVGVYPEAGYTFVSWNDGDLNNPRQLAVNSNRTLRAILVNSSIVTIHDTTYITQIQIDTVTEYIDVPVHDTTIVTLMDTVTRTEYIDVFIHDTTVVTMTDTVTLTETVVQFDTVTLTETVVQFDTVTLTETVVQFDTVTLTETMLQFDTVTITEYVNVFVHDTTVVTLTDTVLLPETVILYDTVLLPETVILHDTVMLPETVILHDTVTITETVVQFDTVMLPETVIIHDTMTMTEYVSVHDTTVVTLTDTVTLTETVVQFDTVTVTEYVPVHDTTVVTLTDTVTLTETVVQYDTVTLTETVIQFDTVTLTEYVDVFIHDTTFVTTTDTVTLTETVIQFDTVTLTEYVDVFIHDTTVVTMTDTVTMTEYMTVHDTTLVTDTLWLTSFDTVYLFDTIIMYDTVIIHDTIYITNQGIDGTEATDIKVYAHRGQIVVEGAEGGQVTLFDVIGRTLATKQDEYYPLRFDVPVSGTYMIKVGNHPAKKVVVIK